MDTTKSVINLLHQAIKRKADKEKERRAIKKFSKNIFMSTEPDFKLPDENEERIEVDAENEERKKKKSKKNEEVVLVSKIAEIIGVELEDGRRRRAGIYDLVEIKGIPITWLVDTRAALAVINEKEAHKLKIKSTSIKVKLSGIGLKKVIKGQLVIMKWKNGILIYDLALISNVIYGYYSSLNSIVISTLFTIATAMPNN